MDIEHFEIMVKAMLCWSDEPRAPRKTQGRATPAGERDELDGGEDEPLVDDDEDDDDAPLQHWRAAPAVTPADAGADADEAGLPESEPLD